MIDEVHGNSGRDPETGGRPGIGSRQFRQLPAVQGLVPGRVGYVRSVAAAGVDQALRF